MARQLDSVGNRGTAGCGHHSAWRNAGVQQRFEPHATLGNGKRGPLSGGAKHGNTVHPVGKQRLHMSRQTLRIAASGAVERRQRRAPEAAQTRSSSFIVTLPPRRQPAHDRALSKEQ